MDECFAFSMGMSLNLYTTSNLRVLPVNNKQQSVNAY
jgi:hypothetical protein